MCKENVPNVINNEKRRKWSCKWIGRDLGMKKLVRILNIGFKWGLRRKYEGTWNWST